MPAKLDRCVTGLMNRADLIKKYPDAKVRRQHAYAICTASTQGGEYTDDAQFGYIVEANTITFKDESNTTWLQALPLGEYDHPRFGKIDITPERVKQFSKNVNMNVRGTELDIDYEHKTSVEGGKAAGWVKSAEDRGTDGLWISVEWTPNARKALEDGEYRYFSPEFKDEWCHPKTKKCYSDVLFGGALTNRPFLKDIMPINLSDFFAVPDGKYPQEEAHYRQAGSSERRCLNCAFWRNGSCLTVDGEIEQDYVSDFYKPIYVDMGGLFDEDEYDPFQFRDVPAAEKNKASASDFAGKNKSFPILKPEDVSAAASSLGRAGTDNYSTDQIKANIIRIAKRKGAAFVAKLPESWKKSLEEVEMDELLKQLRESLGLPEDAEEGKVVEAITSLKTFHDSKASEETKARKFEEDYPEEAKRLREQNEALVKGNAQATVKALIEKGVPPVVNEDDAMVNAIIAGDVPKLTELIGTIAERGLVKLNEENGGSQGSSDETLEDATKKLMDADPKLSFKEALAKARQENPKLAEDYASKGIPKTEVA